MKRKLEKAGFMFVGTCNCDGYHTEKYKNGDYRVKWRTLKGTFKVLKYGHVVVNWTSIDLLESTLLTYATIQEKA